MDKIKKGIILKKIGIVGACGYVGSAFARMIEGKYEAVLYDPKLGDKSATKKQINDCDLAVIGVPTAMSERYHEVDGIKVYDGDTSIVEECVSWIETPVILIKSTIRIGTTEYLKNKYNKRIVFSPEYVGEGKYKVSSRMDFQTDMSATPFLILGGDKEDCDYIFDLLTPILGPEKKYFKTDSKTAEFIKYKENDYFAHKVVWAAEAREQAEALGVNWYDAWQGWALDPRVDVMHSCVFKDNEGFAGFCLPKDTNALAYRLIEEGYVPEFQLGMLKKNLKLRKVKDYQELSGKK
jgi:UDPglucose 6-dehydrogenase